MTRRWLNRGMVFLFVALLGAGVACESDSGGTPTPDTGGGGTPDSTTPPADTGGGTPDISSGACDPTTMLTPGMAWRFTLMDVTEPSQPPGLPRFLNNIWTPDVDAYRLNIVLRLDGVEVQGDGSVLATVTAGSGWHNLSMQEVMPVEGGDLVPTTYTFVPDTETSTFTITIQPDGTFVTNEDAALWFHPGPWDYALICSAGDPSINLPKDTIPIANLVAHGKMVNGCQTIIEGDLTGCIAEEAACQICSYGMAPDYSAWSYSEDPTKAGEPCTSSYCQRWCGDMTWANFGAFVRGLRVPKTCDVNGDGTNDAYGLAGFWQAQAVPFE